MAKISESMLPLEERMKYFSWIATVNKRFSKCFPSDYDEETLHFFHREIEKELEAISVCSTKKNEALFSTLLCFYNHFCWKTKWKEPSPHMKSSCVRILSSICRVGLVLSKGNVQSKWINQVLSAVSVFPGDHDYLYDALLQIYKFNKKYYSAYAAILRHILLDPQPKTENPCTFFKLLLLFRRLKFLLQNPYEKVRVDALAAAVSIPRNLMSWLADNELQDVSKAMKKDKMIIMKGKFSKVLLVRLREAVLHNTYRKTSLVSKYNETTQFTIDCNPETVNNELLPKSLNMEEDIVNTEADVEITKSKRKSAVSPSESNMGSATKKRKKRDLDHKLKEKRTSIGQSPREEIHNNELSEIPIECIDSNLDSNTLSKSKKMLKKNCKTTLDQVSQKEVNKMSVDINLKEESKSPISTNGDEIESDSMLIQSYSSAIEFIKKGRKKRNTINIAEEFNPKDIENEASINENDLAHVQSIKKGKKKRKTINIVEDIEKSSNFDEKKSLIVQSAKKDQKNKKNVNVQNPQDVENELAVNEKTVSSTKKGKKRKSINISQENILSDRGGQSDSETDVSLYVQSIETDKNRRKTINIAQDTSQKSIEKDLLNVSSSKKSQKKRQTINIVEEINPKNIEYQSKFNENISLCTPPVTNQSDSSSTPRSVLKTNKKRKSSHCTSAGFIVTPCENVDSVTKENFNKDLTKRTSISTKSEWIVTVNKSDSNTISLTPKTPPEKHNFKVSELTETTSGVVAIETIDIAEVEVIAERNDAKDIVTQLTLTSTTSESEIIDTGDEEADESISDLESLNTAEKAKSYKFTNKTGSIKPIAKAVKFVEETESIIYSTNEAEAEDDDESISETESVDTAEEAKSSESTDETETIKTKIVKFVEKAESIISTSEIEASSTDDEEPDESISETESVDTAEKAESVDTDIKEKSSESTDETETIRTKMAKFVEETESIISASEIEAANTDDEKADESISETKSVDTTEEAESSGETETMPITETVKFVDEAENIVSTNEADAFESVDKTGESNSPEEAGTVETTESKEESVEVTESVEKVVKVNETPHVAPSVSTEFSEPLADAENVGIAEEDKIMETVKIAESVEMVGEVRECYDVDPSDKTKDFKSIPEPVDEKNVEGAGAGEIIEGTNEIFSTLEAFESIPETGYKTVEDVETDEDKGTSIIIEKTNDVNFFNKAEDFKSILETNEESMNKIRTEETVEEGKLVDIVKETEIKDFTNEVKDFEPILETKEGIIKDVEIVLDTNAVNTIEETENMGAINKSPDFKPIPETNDISEKTKDIGSTIATDGFESVPATEEETVNDGDIVVDSEAIEIIEETEDVYSFKNPGGFAPIPETNEETAEVVKIVEGSETIELIEETKDIDSTKEFETIPETEESVRNVETVKGSEAIEIIEEPKDFELIPETQKEFVEKVDVIEPAHEEESEDVVEETENIDSTNRTKHFMPIAETKEKTDENAEALEIVLNEESTCSTLEEATTVPIDESKTIPTVYQSQTIKNDTGTNIVESMEVVDVVKDKNATESIAETETVESISKSEAVDIIQETDVKASDEIEALKLVKDRNTNEFIETDGTYIKTKAVETDQETKEVKSVEKAEVPENLESTDRTETEDSDEILEITDSADRTETEDTDEFLEIHESTDDKTEAEEIDKQLENLESTNKAKAEENADMSGDMECIAEKEKVIEPKDVVVKKVSGKYGYEHVCNSTQCSSDISESELNTSIKKYDSLVKEIFCDAVSDDSVRESLSPYKIENVKILSIESASSQSAMSPKSSTEIPENNPSLIKNCEISSLNSDTYLNSSENIADEDTEIEEAAPINDTQYYCKLLLKEVTEDNFVEDSDNETIDESKNIVDLELPNNIPNQSSSEKTTFDSQAQFKKHSSAKIDISSSKIVVDTISNNEKAASNETETVESIAEGLYKKILKAKEERLSLTSSVPEKTADTILTENTVSYVIGKVIKKVEDVNNLANEKSFADVKEQVKFTPERSQLPKLGNLSNLKPFGFPNEKSECLSFVDFSKERVSDSTESCPQAKRNFYPYRNLLTFEVLDDKSESNFSDLVVDDKLEETTCVPNEEDSSDDETEIDEDVSQSPVCNIIQNATIVEESKINEESQTSVLEAQNSPKLDSEELKNLVRTVKVPVVNLGHKCDDLRFEGEVSQHDNNVASSHDKNELLSTKTEKQIGAEVIVESQASISISQESKSKESEPENEVVTTTRKLRNRNLSLSVVTGNSTCEEKHQTPEKSSRTRSRRKPSNLETSKSTEFNSAANSTNLRRSTRRLRNEFKELRLDSPKRCNPVDEVADQNLDSDSNVKSAKSKKLITCSTSAKRNDSAVAKSELDCSDRSVEVDQGTDLPKDTSNNSSTRKRATRSTAAVTKITEYFSVQTKTELTPFNETESEYLVEDSAELSAEKLPVRKRFTRSNAVASDMSRSGLLDAKEDVEDSNLGDVKSKKTVPKRSTRTNTRGASRTKLSQNTLAKEESDEEDIDTQSNVSEESHKENVANEDESASKEVESSSKEYNLRRSTRNLIRPSRLKLSQDHF